MRNFLMKLMATITCHPRYHPEQYELDKKTHWSSKIWVSNIFRAYEWLFGRGLDKYGGSLRAETSSSIERRNGKTYVSYRFFTLEAFLSHIEVTIRLQLSTIYEWLKNPNIFPVPEPVYLTLGIGALILPTIKTDTNHLWIFGMGAIAFDTSANSTTTGTSLTYSHTCTGSNLILVVGTSPILQGGENTNSVTYNTISFGAADVTQGESNKLVNQLWHLVNPATGANNVVMTVTTSAPLYSISASYSGAKQTGQPDAAGSANPGLGTPVSSITVTITVVNSNCWMLSYVGSDDGNSQTASTGVNAVRGNTTPGIAYLGDSNGTVATGSQSQTWTCTAQVESICGLSIAPAVSIITGGTLSLLGVG